MTDTASTHSSPTSLPAGRWQIDPASSEVEFKSRGMWGLAGVRGTFAKLEGTLHVDDDGAARGSLKIAATSLDTGNAKRDTHLRSADFFDVENHPTVTFSLTGAADGQLRGVLSVRDNDLPLDAPLTVTVVSPEQFTLSTAIAVDRDAAGLGWSKMGMIRGQAHLRAEVNLVPDPSAT